MGRLEALVKYHSAVRGQLTRRCEATAGTVAGGEFDWGGRLPKSTGGAQGFPQAGWQSAVACKGTRELDCKADRPRREETRT